MANKEKVFTAFSDSFSEILTTHNILNIPHYQRGYAWGAKQIEELVLDIQEAIGKKESQYFIGLIALLSKDLSTLEFDVIDGQQRLTTLLLITYYISKKLENSQNQTTRELAITQRGKVVPLENDKRIPVVKHKRPIERESLSYILSDYKEPKTDSSILKAYESAIPNCFEDKTEEDLSQFLTFLMDNTIFIVAECSDDGIAYQIFETLNNRGSTLSEIDLIRNRLFSNISENSVDEYWRKWDSLYSNLKGALNGVTLDKHVQFLFSFYLICHFGEWIEPKELFLRLKEYLKQRNNDSKQSPSEELLAIITNEQASKSYIRLHKPSDTKNNSIVGLQDALEDYNYIIIKPLIFIMMHKNIEGQIIVKIIQMAGNLIKRTQALGTIPTEKYGRAFAKIAQKIQTNAIQEKMLLREFYEILKEADKNHKNIMDDKSFIDGLCAASSIKEDVAKDMFVSIYNFDKQSDKEKLKQSPTLHLEHILPREYHTKNWGQFTPEEHQNYYQRLGNLAILGEKINKEAAQKSFDIKKEKHYSESRYKIFIDDYNEWNIENIKKRQEQIATKIAEVWGVRTS